MEKIRINNEIIEYELSNRDNTYNVTLQESNTEFQIFKYGSDYLLFNTTENTFRVLNAYQTKDKTIIWIDDEELMLEEESEDSFAGEDETVENVIKSPMPGTIKEIKFKEQDSVKKGDTVVILESMKVLNELKSQVNGIIKKISIQTGSQVGPLETLVEIEPQEEK